MKTVQSIGGGELAIHGDEVHVRQRPGPEANWQDSVVLVWWDDAHKIGGFHRIGHEPNVPAAEGGPQITLWNNLVAPEGVYRNTVYQPLREADKLASGGYGSGDDTCRCEFVNSEHIWTIADGDVSAELRHRDMSPNVDCYPKKDGVLDDFAPAHFDVPGQVTGWLKVKGKEYRVNGLSVRDHGWGPRDWNGVLSHRWVAGASQDLGFVCLSWHTPSDAFACFGWVVKGNQVIYAKKLDILTYTEIDGASNRGGRVRMELANGEVLEIEATAVAPSLHSNHHSICCTDTLCTVTVNGQAGGFCDFESSANLQHGKRLPQKAVGLVANGWHPHA